MSAQTPAPATPSKASELFWRYSRARSEGNQDLASSLWMEYCRALEQEQKGSGVMQ